MISREFLGPLFTKLLVMFEIFCVNQDRFVLQALACTQRYDAVNADR